MTRILTRLRKLEAQLIDHNGLVPRTTSWWNYWTPRTVMLIAGEPLDQKVPFEVIDAFVHGADGDR